MKLLELLLFAGSAFAGEYAVFPSGARLHVDRHEADGDKLRLFNGSGYTEVASAAVVGFEREEVPPAAPQAVAALTTAPAIPAPQSLDFRRLVDQAADRYGLPKAFVRSVVKAESGFQQHAISRKGAVGLMQLMPGTASDLGANPHDAAQNVDAGTRYLRDLLLKYDGGMWRALAAYNAGPGAVDKYHGVPPYSETRNYIRRIQNDYTKARQQESAGGQ